MKLLSIAIPCYNSESYMKKCVESLLIGGEEVEILIVDDGSTKDRTAQIADDYAAKYPSIVKTIHKENGGHGSAVNTGIANALILKLNPKRETIHAVTVVPILAPNVTPTDCASERRPAFTKETTITVVAPDD